MGAPACGEVCEKSELPREEVHRIVSLNPERQVSTNHLLASKLLFPGFVLSYTARCDQLGICCAGIRYKNSYIHFPNCQTMVLSIQFDILVMISSVL